MAKQISTKRVAISKANAQMVGAVAFASAISVFCLMASNTILGQYRYQGKVIAAKQDAADQLTANLKAFNDLQKSYRSFDRTDPNIIAGSRNGTGDQDGSNSKIILDALPRSYDFPALTSSVEKIAGDVGLSLNTITGTDDEVAQHANVSSPSPEPVSIPFTFSVAKTSYDPVKKLAAALQLSIRPIQVDKIQIVIEEESGMTATFDAHTYFQPSKNLSITTKVIK